MQTIGKTICLFLLWAVNILSPNKALSIGGNEKAEMANEYKGLVQSGLNELSGLQNISFKHLSVDDGLSQVSVNSISQDSEGFMWFATQDGIDRYDGKDFLNFRHSDDKHNSIPGNWVTFVEVTRDGSLWVGSNGNGVARKLTNSSGFKKVSFLIESKPIQGVRAKNMFQDSLGTIWLASWGHGLFRYDIDIDKFISVWNPDNANKRIWTVAEWQSQLLIGTDEGEIWTYDSKQNEFRLWQYQSHGVGKIQHIISRNNQLWVATDKGLWRHSLSKPLTKVVIPNMKELKKELNVYRLFVDNQNNLWAGTLGDGLFINFHDGGWIQQKSTGSIHGLSNDRILSFYQDRTGIVWIGTESGGLNYFDPLSIQFNNIGKTSNSKSSLNDSMVFAVNKTSNGDWWIGTESGGVNHWRKTHSQFYIYNQESGHLLNNTVRSILPTDNGVWIGGFGGLAFIDYNGNLGAQFDQESLPALAHNAIFTLERADDNRIWIGSYGGLDLFDTLSQSIVSSHRTSDTHNPLPRSIVTALHQDNSILWIGTWGGGLVKYDLQSQSMEYFKNDEKNTHSLSNNSIWNIFTSSDSKIWIGTDGGGLNLYEPSIKSFLRIQQSDGLANPVVYGIAEDVSGHLWLSTNRGLSKFDPKTLKVRNYFRKDGLQGREFNAGAYYSDNSVIAFGGINGVSVFSNQKAKVNPIPPETQVVDYRLYNRSYKELERNELNLIDKNGEVEVRLTHQQKMLTFEFRALHYSGSKSNRFKYRLLGLNEQWITSKIGQFEATYTNLSPGQYTFEVYAISKDNVVDESPSKVYLVVEPPLWRSELAYLLYTIGLIFIIYSFRRSYQKKLEFQKTLNARLVEISSLKERLNTSERMSVLGELASNIAHSLRNPLANIRTTAELMEDEVASNRTWRKELSQIISEVDRLSLWIRELLNYSKDSFHFDSLDIVGRCRMLVEEFKTNIQLSRKDVGVHFYSELAEAKIKADGVLLNHLFNSLFTNALESIIGKGEITLSIEPREVAKVAIIISDTGSGMSKDLQEKIFEIDVTEKEQGLGLGLSLIKRISERHGAAISVHSRVGKGASFEIVFDLDEREVS